MKILTVFLCLSPFISLITEQWPLTIIITQDALILFAITNSLGGKVLKLAHAATSFKTLGSNILKNGTSNKVSMILFSIIPSKISTEALPSNVFS